jgi:hypothetical protein
MVSLRSLTKPGLSLTAVCLAVAAQCAPQATAQTSAVASPTVIGPIASPDAPGAATRNYPWMTTQHVLKDVGYVEEEYFYQGTASRFNTAAAGGATPTNAALTDSGHVYKTRMLVRRPADPKKFNGTVLVEWQNVTAGYDIDAMWATQVARITRAGYAWVGIDAQRVGVQQAPNGLKLWSPTRYGSLDVTDGGKITDDALSYDIFAQGIQAIKHPMAVNPLGPLKAQRIIAIGASQSAAYMGTYINSLHAALGGSIDGYFLQIGGARIRDDIPVPVFKQLSETDVPGQVAARQPDTAKYRQWEIPGTSHATRILSLNNTSTNHRDGVFRSPTVCKYPINPRTPIEDSSGVIYDLMNTWIKDGALPPTAPKTDVEQQGETPGRNGAPARPNYVIKRDARGNSSGGGIRLADLVVPTAIQSRENEGSQFCNLYGQYQPFPDEVINQLYPTHAGYVAAVRSVTAGNLKAGYLEAPEAARAIRRAEESYVGSGDPCKAACRAAQDLENSTLFYLVVTGQADQKSSQVNAIVRQITRADGPRGKPSDRTAALKGLDGYISQITAMQMAGTLSETSAKELVTAANDVKKAVSTP